MKALHPKLIKYLILLTILSVFGSADTVTVTAAFPGGYPQSITTTATTFTYDLGAQFSSVTSACFSSSFSGNLWDPHEAYFISGVGGQINNSPFSSSFASMCANPANFAQFLSGSGSLQYYSDGEFGAPGASMTLTDLTLTVTGTEVSNAPEPGSLALFGSGLVSLGAILRRRFLS